MATHPVDPDSGAGTSVYDGLADLPEPVRNRVVALTAEVLAQVPGLPPAVRRVAGFAPNRRARLGGGAIAEALLDVDLRERVAVQVAARPGRDDDQTDAAARAWLTRGEGWEDVVVAARAAASAGDDAGRDGAGMAELTRLRERVEAAEQSLREARTKARSQVEEYKSENATLRRKLGESRSTERQARETAEEAVRLAEEARSRASSLESGQDKELRRLRARVEQLEAEQAAQRREERRTSRADRDEATVRARLLLDSVIEAASGLRRELGLPAVPGAPGDRVEAELAGAGDDGPVPGSVAVLASGSVLEQVISLPRARLLVDGYNVSKSAWAQSSLESQRQRLLRALAPVVARTGAETTVVFDAANLTSRPVVAAPRGVKVVFSPPGVIADDVLRDLVAAEPPGRTVVVVTDDQEVARDARAAGARLASAAALVELLDRG